MESTNNFIPDINKALEILNQGGIILYPTDTYTQPIPFGELDALQQMKVL